MTNNDAYIFLNGTFTKNLEFYNSLNINKNNIFCADGGAKKAIELNIAPTEVWGDFDSLTSEEINWLKKKNVKLVTFNVEKDFTDGELLIQYVSSLNFNKIYVIGGIGGRLDHELTNINLMFKYKNIIFKEEKEELFSISKEFTLNNLKGCTVSFIPFSDYVTDLTLKGFKYPLNNHILYRGDSTCMSNILIENTGEIFFSSGKLLCSLNY